MPDAPAAPPAPPVMTDAEFVHAFESGSIAAADFHHVDHLRLAWAYLDESATLGEATRRMGQALRRFAAAAGAIEKYSDAVTTFWMAEMAAARATSPAADFHTLLAACPHLLDGRRTRAS